MLTVLAISGCARRQPLPSLTGAAPSVVVRSALDGAGLTVSGAGPLLLDSTAFARLAELASEGPTAGAAWVSDVAGPVRFVDPADVLECPDRRPCRIRGNATFVTVWDAVLTGDLLTVTVSLAANEERLYTMTRHVTHVLELQRGPTGWRLTARERID